MKGYKAAYNYKCLDHEYQVGSTYKIKGKLKLCSNGFHFCEKPTSVLRYYKLNNKFNLFEVEAVGLIIKDFYTTEDKFVTDEIFIKREITDFEEFASLLQLHYDIFKNKQFQSLFQRLNVPKILTFNPNNWRNAAFQIEKELIIKAKKKLCSIMNFKKNAFKLPFELNENCEKPTIKGDFGGYFNRRGERINHPNAYAKVGWSNMFYRESTRRIEVSTKWLEEHDCKDLLLLLNSQIK